jgi:hypothetical protein
MPELLEIGFERLDRTLFVRLSAKLNLPVSFGAKTDFGQLALSRLSLGPVSLKDVTVGIYIFDGLRDLELSINHPCRGSEVRLIVSTIEKVAKEVGVTKWKVGLEPLGDEATLYFSDQGPGKLWNDKKLPSGTGQK